MIQQTSAKIYLAAERGCNENEYMRCYSTFNFGQFRNVHKQPFGSLTVWNDDTIAPGHSVKMHIDKDGYIVFIPLVGTIACKDPEGKQSVLSAGEVYIMYVQSGALVEVTNHLQEELVNFLHIRVNTGSCTGSDASVVLRFHIDQYRNKLALMEPVYGKDVIESLPFCLGVTKVEGRNEIEYPLAEPGNGVFVFVVNGAFEVQNRLLHERDGLALWDTEIIEAEALSNDAILIILEIPLL